MGRAAQAFDTTHKAMMLKQVPTVATQDAHCPTAIASFTAYRVPAACSLCTPCVACRPAHACRSRRRYTFLSLPCRCRCCVRAQVASARIDTVRGSASFGLSDLDSLLAAVMHVWLLQRQAALDALAAAWQDAEPLGGGVLALTMDVDDLTRVAGAAPAVNGAVRHKNPRAPCTSAIATANVVTAVLAGPRFPGCARAMMPGQHERKCLMPLAPGSCGRAACTAPYGTAPQSLCTFCQCHGQFGQSLLCSLVLGRPDTPRRAEAAHASSPRAG